MYDMQESESDGGIVTFKSTHPKCSFAKVDDNGVVTEVGGEEPNRDNATVGYYYWRKGSDFVRYAEQMIERDIRVNNEFYVCPVYNGKQSKMVRRFESLKLDEMWSLGSPEDLDFYLKEKK